MSSALQSIDERELRDNYSDGPRALARLNSASGRVAGKWLEVFPSSWWPTFHDTSFIMALRLRCGMHVSAPGQHCMHAKLKDREVKCDTCLDVWGDHCISCGFGGHLFTRHTAVNNVLVEAGRAAGYTVHCEQVVPELAQRKLKSGVGSIQDARIDVELFGHPYAPDYLLDGTIKHPGAASYVMKAAGEIGYAAEEGVKAKAKRYPPRRGKSVLCCAMETWGRISVSFEAFLRELATLASRRQRERGMQPTKWLCKWQTQLSLCVALHVGRCLLDALPGDEQRELSFGRFAPYGGADVMDTFDGSVGDPLEGDPGDPG